MDVFNVMVNGHMVGSFSRREAAEKYAASIALKGHGASVYKCVLDCIPMYLIIVRSGVDEVIAGITSRLDGAKRKVEDLASGYGWEPCPNREWVETESFRFHPAWKKGFCTPSHIYYDVTIIEMVSPGLSWLQ
jgi:hypothetical protein